jgi:hypothetical protein
MENIQFNKFSENYFLRLFELCFKYYNHNVENEIFEEESDMFIKEDNCTSAERKYHIKTIIEFIEKNYNTDQNVLYEILNSHSKII